MQPGADNGANSPAVERVLGDDGLAKETTTGGCVSVSSSSSSEMMTG